MSGPLRDRSAHRGEQSPHVQEGEILDKEAFRAELQRVLAGPSFRSSKRCTEFLSLVVERTLEGRQHELKERTLGVTLFGRDPAYDTAGDPVVRVKANEVRKRLAQYYDDHAGAPLRIDLPPGSYLPVFRHSETVPQSDIPASLPDVVSVSPPRRRVRRKAAAWGAGAMLVAAIALMWPWSPRESPLDAFWKPVLQSGREPILCVGTSGHVWLLSDVLSGRLASQLAGAAAPPTIEVPLREAVPAEDSYFSMGSVKSAISLSVFLSGKGGRPQLRLGAPLTIDDFRSHPIVTVGAFSNPWTMQRIAEMRFQFERGKANGKTWLEIADSQNAARSWRVEESPFEPAHEDYALVTRMSDPVSKVVFISLAGLNQFGTEAAAEFVTNPRYWDELARRAPLGWQGKNLQVVLRTAVLESRPNPPRILEVYFW